MKRISIIGYYAQGLECLEGQTIKKQKIIAKDSEKVLIDANDAEKVLIDDQGLYKVAELKQNGFTYWRL